MAFKITVDMPNLGPEGRFTITGLGELQNGKTYKISDEQAEAFRHVNSIVQDNMDPETGQLTNREVVPGPGLDEVTITGITVEKMADEKKPAENQGGGN